MRPSPTPLAIQNYLHAITGLISGTRPAPVQTRCQPELRLKACAARRASRSRSQSLRRVLPVVLAGFFVVSAQAQSAVVGASAAPVVSASPPLTLDVAIKLALENNQRVKVSAFSPQIARAN